MRWLLDVIAILTAGGLIAAVVMFNRVENERESQVRRAIADLRRIELEVKYRAVTKACPLNELGWPHSIDPAWFDNDPPRNTLLSPKRPWLEIAGESEARLLNPRIRLAVDDSLAGFWYNPFQGIIRARVPVMLSDQESVNLYNRVNQTALSSVFERDPEPPNSPAAAGRAGGPSAFSQPPAASAKEQSTGSAPAASAAAKPSASADR